MQLNWRSIELKTQPKVSTYILVGDKRVTDCISEEFIVQHFLVVQNKKKR